MKFPELKDLLAANGYVLECESPLEIRSEDGNSFASNQAAELIIEQFQRFYIKCVIEEEGCDHIDPITQESAIDYDEYDTKEVICHVCGKSADAIEAEEEDEE